MKTSAIISTVSFASIALAASNSPLIPDGISTTCSSFLTTLNTDTSLAACTNLLLTTTKAFAPGSASAGSAAVTSALAGLCGSTTTCSASAIRAQLVAFYAACPDELSGASPNQIVRNAYDVLYLFTPLHDAICTQDTSTSKYCVLSTGSSATVTANSTAALNVTVNAATTPSNPFSAQISKFLSYPINQSALSRRADSSAALAPNATTYKSTSLPFLFILPTFDATELCTPCTKAVLTAYVTWEASLTYAFGIANSGILGGQVELWSSVQTKCPADFMTAVVSNTGGAPLGGALSGAMNVQASMAAASLIGAFAVALSMMML